MGKSTAGPDSRELREESTTRRQGGPPDGGLLREPTELAGAAGAGHALEAPWENDGVGGGARGASEKRREHDTRARPVGMREGGRGVLRV